jgi:hypothetical protein
LSISISRSVLHSYGLQTAESNMSLLGEATQHCNILGDVSPLRVKSRPSARKDDASVLIPKADLADKA